MKVELLGPTQRKVARAADPEGAWTPMPSPQPERATIRRLVARKVMEISPDGESYRLLTGMIEEPRRDLLKRLREGALSSEDWAEVATSRNSLRVRIHKLREKGHDIVTQPLPRARDGGSSVLYILNA